MGLELFFCINSVFLPLNKPKNQMKLKFLMLSSLLFISSLCFAQLGVRVGTGLTMIRVDSNNPKTLAPSNDWFGELGVFYQQKLTNFFIEPSFSYVSRSYYDNNRLGNIELFLPVGYQVQTKLPLRFFTGVSATYVLNSNLRNFWVRTTGQGALLSKGDEKINFLLGLKIGAGVKYKRIIVDLVYEQFLNPHYSSDYLFTTIDYYNRGITLKAGYLFW